MPRSLADAGVPRILTRRRRINLSYQGGVQDVVEVDDVTHRHAMNLMIGTTQVLQELGETATPTFDSVALSSMTPGDTVIVGPGGVLTGSSGSGIVPSLRLLGGGTKGIAVTSIILTWSATEHDNTSWFSGPSTDITVDADGLYAIQATVLAGSGGTTNHEVSLLVNGLGVNSTAASFSDGVVPVNTTVPTVLSLSAGDVITVQYSGDPAVSEVTGAVISVTKIGVLS